ncbi:hypothetical protein CLAFUW4_07480 [Fulvia fulva]|uniref:Uncharacterized protein n=1 Tax=Passalora fulva TaxID=5499 RepID=A0A9Q8UQL4_PASFU|nr:uncharacterized protein CLAFUR5_07610 [Fulvia fulva]KAK4622061.1 hypothetical protein CLAFUR4_07486 [Fulvia fulva]KAK4623168.1 hypothetical protein CLAFUR0_07486 [Fulvia fulva]UJO18806.1 hypothetical protein CLAFUR5_07610 [Fulvia fulva]WPV16451.1 hypothetical protein CLAFUW4_07480 [Fulvia fulva]WPV31593.1 hypothetical protein CLAFUW7_07482 [Fulvia fulva]
MAHYNPFVRSTNFGEERIINIEFATNEDPLDRAERIAHDKSTQKKLPDLFKVVVPSAERAAHRLRLMRIEFPPMDQSQYWLELQVGGNLVIHGCGDFKPRGYCDVCNSWGKGCGPKIEKDDSGRWVCWHGRWRDYEADWAATQALINRGFR